MLNIRQIFANSAPWCSSLNPQVHPFWSSFCVGERCGLWDMNFHSRNSGMHWFGGSRKQGKAWASGGHQQWGLGRDIHIPSKANVTETRTEQTHTVPQPFSPCDRARGKSNACSTCQGARCCCLENPCPQLELGSCDCCPRSKDRDPSSPPSSLPLLATQSHKNKTKATKY